ncbi:MAG: hypothetical protein HDT33_10400 [Clostridiales bacterium]|nr:hypothetical protein [Clostridiales bacterium]
MDFLYDRENLCFSVEQNDIRFSCEQPTPSLKAFANRLARKYRDRLPFLAEFVVKSDEFLETYGVLSADEFMALLKEMTIPWVFLHSGHHGTIAYCDSDYVIEFAFTGDFETFDDLSVDS